MSHRCDLLSNNFKIESSLPTVPFTPLKTSDLYISFNWSISILISEFHKVKRLPIVVNWAGCK